MSKTVDRPLPTPVRVSDLAEFLRVENNVVRALLHHLLPGDPMPTSTDRVEPIFAQAFVACLMTGRINRHDEVSSLQH